MVRRTARAAPERRKKSASLAAPCDTTCAPGGRRCAAITPATRPKSPALQPLTSTISVDYVRTHRDIDRATSMTESASNLSTHQETYQLLNCGHDNDKSYAAIVKKSKQP